LNLWFKITVSDGIVEDTLLFL